MNIDCVVGVLNESVAALKPSVLPLACTGENLDPKLSSRKFHAKEKDRDYSHAIFSTNRMRPGDESRDSREEKNCSGFHFTSTRLSHFPPSAHTSTHRTDAVSHLQHVYHIFTRSPLVSSRVRACHILVSFVNTSLEQMVRLRF